VPTSPQRRNETIEPPRPQALSVRESLPTPRQVTTFRPGRCSRGLGSGDQIATDMTVSGITTTDPGSNRPEGPSVALFSPTDVISHRSAGRDLRVGVRSCPKTGDGPRAYRPAVYGLRTRRSRAHGGLIRTSYLGSSARGGRVRRSYTMGEDSDFALPDS
jgi:hypothetical protein